MDRKAPGELTALDRDSSGAPRSQDFTGGPEPGPFLPHQVSAMIRGKHPHARHSFSRGPNVMPSSGDDFAVLLRRAQAGDPAAREQLVASLYQDFRALAHRRMRRERPGHTLQTSDLVHEALKRIL